MVPYLLSNVQVYFPLHCDSGSAFFKVFFIFLMEANAIKTVFVV